ncbi:MAG: glycosyltransferase family 2 protein [Bacteroidota bacterium]|nr:glycosyltransferase family 2 protein [Bacteroidota bacterium]
MIRVLLVIGQGLIIFYLLVPFVAYILVTLKRLLFPGKSKPVVIAKNYDFAAIVCAHQQPIFIGPLVDSLQKQVYKNIHIYVVADKVREDLSYLNAPNVTILKPKHDLNAKTKSIKLAIDNFIRTHDAIAVFDADNLVHPEYFNLMNRYFNKGYKMVQGRIAPKNLNTDAACMDAANETYYTFIDKFSRSKLGLSSGIWGLGFVIDLEVFKQVKFDVYLSGFDKKLQATAILLVDRIGYESQAIVFDEKTSTGDGLIQQRSKWLYGYFRYAKLGVGVVLKGITSLSFDKIYYGINHMRPPLVVLFPAAAAFIVLDLLLDPLLAYIMLGSIAAFFVSFVLIILTYANDKRVVQVLPKIPRFVVLQMLAMMKVRKAKKHTHTSHSHVISIEEVMENIKPNAQ